MTSTIGCLYACRAGLEADLVDELARVRPNVEPRKLAAALVASRGTPPTMEFTFARQAFAVAAVVRAASASDLDAKVAHALPRATRPWALQVWVPDSPDGNRLAKSAETLQRAVELRAASVDVHWADRRVPTAAAARDARGDLVQVCLAEPRVAYVGSGPAVGALSLHVGGRARMRVSTEAPSRAAMKLEEAIDWLGLGPAAGELCVDLGAAPGGWSHVVLERGARVIAIDPGAMAPNLAKRRGLVHIRGSAFDFEPREPVDWLLCDMVWRPLEVAALLARWARKRWARLVIANIKLPMRAKVDFVERVRGVLAQGGWTAIRFRQLYHDREEVTLTAHCAG